ncbi:GNAT family protein [Nonomuraea sp. NPDC004580]|uniref:GNAT family N-acetyltransferase n=1 Tax=Nonomuraea sp. NPDC004580 TaxID=3154552 RepID=UPI00339E3492
MILLRSLEPADAAVIASWIDDQEALVLWSGKTGFTWPFDAGQLLALREPGRRLLAAVDPAGAVIGHVSLRDQDDHSVRLGLVLVAPSARGKGHGAALVDAALATAFADPGVTRVTLGVYAHNAGARRLYERFGFEEEQVYERSIEAGGQWWTSVTMGLAREAWRAGR